jgi:hypothetical protein
MDTHTMLTEADYRWTISKDCWKSKKKPYWIKLFFNGVAWDICLRGRNKFLLKGGFYEDKREANQQAKRLAKALGLEFRQ